ncbi:MAG TPA: CdaR family protein [Kofleriaceae bacterium]|nr:CdaR family protein [Kofleriaceae bacterium]
MAATPQQRPRRATTRHEAAPNAARLLAQDPQPPRPFGAQVAAWLRGALFDNAALKFVALVLSLTVFILVHSDEEKTAFATVGIIYDEPNDRVMVSNRPEKVRIEVKGTRRRLKRLHDADLDDIHVDLAQVEAGRLPFRPEMVKDLPDGLELVSFDPPNIAVKFEDRVAKQVPVSADTAGSPGRGTKVEAIVVKPAKVTVSGAESRIASLAVIETAPVALEGRSRTFRDRVPLAVPPDVVVDGSLEVEVEVTLGEEQGSRQVQLPVLIEPGRGLAAADTARFSVDPETVQVVLRGSILAIDKVREDELTAQVRLEPGDVSGGKVRKAEVRVTPALQGIGVEVSPVEVTLKPRQIPR